MTDITKVIDGKTHVFNQNDEALFRRSLAQSMPPVFLMGGLMFEAGWCVQLLERVVARPDPGDLLIWHLDDQERKIDVHTVDVKRSFQWKYHEYPHWWTDLLLSQKHEMRFDWWYAVINMGMTNLAFVDMTTVPIEEVTYRTTKTHGRKHDQLSTVIPMKYVHFREIHATSVPVR